jgi:hypothetical protein
MYLSKYVCNHRWFHCLEFHHIKRWKEFIPIPSSVSCAAHGAFIVISNTNDLPSLTIALPLIISSATRVAIHAVVATRNSARAPHRKCLERDWRGLAVMGGCYRCWCERWLVQRRWIEVGCMIESNIAHRLSTFCTSSHNVQRDPSHLCSRGNKNLCESSLVREKRFLQWLVQRRWVEVECMMERTFHAVFV